MSSARFVVDIPADASIAFANVSGDWNPLHTDPSYAATTPYGRPVLHGAFSAGLLSRMAGMHLPGRACLLHGLRLRFVAPVLAPVSVVVEGRQVSGSASGGRVSVTISNRETGTRYVEGEYDFGLHTSSLDEPAIETLAPAIEDVAPQRANAASHGTEARYIVTGASGGLGRAICEQLGDRAIGVARSVREGLSRVEDLEAADEWVPRVLEGRRLAGIIHCAWPSPDNAPLTELSDLLNPIEYHVAAPLRQCLALAAALRQHGQPGATLVLFGSTAAEPGRHNYRMPLYSIAKSTLPTMTRALAIELAKSEQRVVSVVLDVIDTGMNQGMGKLARIANANRSPFGTIPTAADAAAQVAWVLENPSPLVSGACMTLAAGALP
jgi:NAD(P)-dependent dehydrogenase (short-subunit alcohol dehydrogenase family)